MVTRNCLAAGLFLILIVSGCKSYNFENKFSFQPAKPSAGENLTILYNSEKTPLENYENIVAYIYFFSNKLDNTKSYKMSREGAGWICEIEIPPATVSLLVKFTDEFGKKEDNNGEMTYIINMFDDSGKELPETKAVYGMAKAARGGIAGMKTNREEGITFLEKSFEANPQLFKKFAGEYFFNINRARGSEAKDIISAKLTELEQMNDNSEDVLITLTKWYRETGDSIKSDNYKEELENRFPNNSFTEEETYNKIYNEKDIDKQKQMLSEFEKQFTSSTYTTRIYYAITNSYIKEDNISELEEFLVSNSDKTHMLSFYNAATHILDNSDNLEIAFNISSAGINRSEKEIINPKSKKPAYYSDEEWIDINKNWAAHNNMLHSKILKEMNKLDDAVSHTIKAVELTRGEDSEINEYYITLLLESKKYDEVVSKSEEFINSGSATEKIKDDLKDAYSATKGSDEGFSKYLESLESEALSELYKELKEEMINEPAADFLLNDLDGSSLSLSELKGKVVIIDFWATWCGPCLNSFPSMKLAVEKFQEDNGVKFLFVNAWERVENKIENAENFISDTKYPFHVLMDLDNKVIGDYGVSGIPTKFIIDGNGNIRFKSVGFDGNIEHLVDEISAMISLARKES